MKLSVPLKNSILTTGSMRAALGHGGTGCRIFVFAGSVPATADAALTMGGDHTQLAVITDNDTGTGLFFAAAAGGVMAKDAAVWLGAIDFGGDGALPGPGPNAPTFLRICLLTDTGRNLATTEPRIQMTCGPSGAEVYIPPMTEGDDQGINVFEIRAVDLPF